MKILIIFIFVHFIFTKNNNQCELNNIKEPWFPVYGEYCGIYHTNHYGIEAIDELDRHCQWHDICVSLNSQGLRSCWCTQQLYHGVSNFKPINQTLSEIKNSILWWLYLANLRCENHYDFHRKFMLSAIRKDPYYKGYNYGTYYGKKEIKTYKTKTIFGSVYLMKFNKQNYNKFTESIFNDPVNNFIRWKPYIVKEINNDTYYEFSVFENENIVLYNNDQYEKTILIDELYCKEFKKTFYSGTLVIVFFGVIALILIILLPTIFCGIMYLNSKRNQSYESI